MHIETYWGKSVPEPNQQGFEQMRRRYTKHSAFNVFAILTKSEDLLPRVVTENLRLVHVNQVGNALKKIPFFKGMTVIWGRWFETPKG